MPNDVIVCPQCGKQLRLRTQQPPRGRVRCPGCEHRFPVGIDGEQPAPPVASASSRSPAPPAATVPKHAADPNEPMFIPIEEPARALESVTEVSVSEAASPTRVVRRRRSPSRFVVPVVVCAVATLGIALLILPKGERPVEREAANGVAKAEAGSRASPISPKNGANDLPATAEVSSLPNKEIAPAQPVSLRAMPAGVRVVIHLHPARLWKRDRQHEELAACAAPLAEWGAKSIEAYCGFPAEQVEEVTFGLIVKGPGVEPDVALVARLADSVKSEQIALKFPPDSKNTSLDAKAPIISRNRAMLRIDDREFANCPKELAKEMADAVHGLNPTDAAIEELLPQTDRRNDLTVIARPDDLHSHADTLIPANAQGIITSAAKWFDSLNAEAVAVSIRLADELRMRVLLRNKAEFTTTEVAQKVKGSMESLPLAMILQVERLNPQNSGRRRVLGRLPAMLKACSMATESKPASKRLLVWNVLLPERAAPNLLLAAHLLWDENRSPLSAAPAMKPAVAEPKKSIAELLKKPIDVDFRRLPIHEAIAFIASETGARIELDGSGLRQAGFTRNMPQTLKLEKSAAGAVLAEIVKAYPKMVLVEDGSGGALITIQAVAEKRQLKPIELPPMNQ